MVHVRELGKQRVGTWVCLWMLSLNWEAIPSNLQQDHGNKLTILWHQISWGHGHLHPTNWTVLHHPALDTHLSDCL